MTLISRAYKSIKSKIVHIKRKIIQHQLLVKNFSYLGLVQLLNMAFPLITYPYLIRVLGADVYGLIVFTQAIILYLVIIIKFGFNISATKDISLNSKNQLKISEITSSVFIIKLVLGVGSVSLLYFLIDFFPSIREHKKLFLFAAHLCLYEVFFPIWYFQGIQQMKHIAILNFIGRGISVVLIFLFVKTPGHYLRVPLLNGIGTIIVSILSLYIVFGIHKIKFHIPRINVLFTHFSTSFPFFISSVSTQLYTNANKVLIGIFLNMREVALYDLAEKITTLLKIPVSLIGQTIYPKNVQTKDIKFIKKIAFYTLAPTVLVYMSIVVFTKDLITVTAGIDMLEASNVIRVLSFSIIPITIGHFLCTQTLIPFGHTKQYMRILIIASILYFSLILIAYYFNFVEIYQIAIITILVQTYIALHSYILVKYKYKIW